jgi:hypothetical protein
MDHGETGMVETLFYEYSGPFFPPARLRGYQERVGNLDVIEHRRRNKVLPYGLRMECQVTTKEQAQRCDTEARQLARDLNTVWAYVALVTLFPKRFMIRLSKPPDGWRTNFKRIKSVRPIKPRSSLPISGPPGPPVGFTVNIKINPGRYKVVLPYMPLQRALAAVQAYRTANQTTRFLMDLHFGAIDQLGTGAQLFLFAKALELARVMLPGRTDSQGEAALPPAGRAALRRSFHWLFDIANNRLEIRHVARGGSLLPKLSPAESADFVHDADVVIRGVVERELGIVAIAQR